MARIAHIADIHVRGLARHAEYREVFARCFKQMQELSPDLIYVGGDIVHSKTQGISPELIDFLTWWFRSLANIAPTHVILGNHDGILMNPDRQDAVSPILSALKDPRITLYKKSGIYPTGIPGVNWCVFSCFDEHGWPKVRPVPGEINIALFHGAVTNSETDIGWKLEGEVDVAFFDGFDFTMLGDIHRQQFLTEDKRIAYSGSTIQQDFGENVEKGFLLWDIRSRNDFDVTFHPVTGANPFYTIEWKGNAECTLQENAWLPKGSRVRIRSTEKIAPGEWKRMQSVLEEDVGAIEVVSQSDTESDVKTFASKELTLAKDDLRDPDIQIRLLHQFFQDVEINTDEWKEIEDTVRRCIVVLSKSDDFTRGSRWTLRKLEFDNTFTFGEGNVINFDALPGITGIFGRNARGKSSIVGTMMYALFNGTDRGSVKNLHIVNTRKQHCVTRATVTVDGELFRFERQTAKHKEKDGSEGALTYLNVLKVDEEGTIIEDHSREQRRVSENVIRAKLGLADDFLMTSLAGQGDMTAFLRQKSTARKAVLTRFLGLDIFDDLLNMVKDEAKEVQGQLKGIPNRDWPKLIQEREDACAKIKVRLKQIDEQIKLLRSAETSLQTTLSNLHVGETVLPEELATQRVKLKDLHTKHDALTVKLAKRAPTLEVMQARLEKIKQERSSIPIDDFKEKSQLLRVVEKNLLEMQHAHEREASTLKTYQKSAAKLSEVPCGDAFPTCKFIKDSHRDKERLEDQQRKVETTLVQLQSVKDKLQQLIDQNVQTAIDRYHELTQQENNINTELNVTKAEVSKIETLLVQFRREIESAQTKLDQMAQKVDQVNAPIIKEKQSELEAARKQMSSLDTERISIATKLGSLETTMESLRKEQIRFQDVNRKWRTYDRLMHALSKRGIPLQIMSSQLPIINSEIAKILQGVVSFAVELEADLNSNDMEIFINYGDSRRIIETASGMEKMISALAIRVALLNVSCLPKTDMLIIDEGFGTLDDLNVEACNRLLVSLKKWFKNILIITHVDGVKDVVDNVIDITWPGMDAKVACE